METHENLLLALQKSIPDEYSEDNLNILEQIVSRYRAILNHVASTNDPDNNTLYYRERMNALEASLTKSKYEHSENQRTKAFLDAKMYTEEGIKALILNTNGQINTNDSL